MNFLKRLAMLIYVALTAFISLIAILYVAHYYSYNGVSEAMYVIYKDDSLRMVFGGIAAGMFVLNLICYRLFSVNVRRDRIIAFDNPSGRVSVSLIALEDMIKRSVHSLKEVKELKSTIRVAKKGLQVKLRLNLRSDVNIPNVTSKVQDLVTKKVQDTIGIDEPVNVSIYVGKILGEPVNRKKDQNEPPDDTSSLPNIPFQGYRA